MSPPSDRYAVCEGVLRQGSFAADVALTRAAGIAAIGVDAGAVDEVGPDEAARILDGEGILVSSYMTLENILGPDGSTASIDEATRRLDVATRLGAPGALVASGPIGTLPADEADARCQAWLEQAGPVAAARDLRIVLEPMHPLMRRWTYVHTLDHALRLVAGVTGAGVVLDLGHLWWEDGLPELVRDHVDAIVSVQVTNVDRAAVDEMRYERAPLAAGDVPVASLIALLESAGYRGWYENEVLARIPRDRRLAMLIESREWFEAL